MLKKIFTHPCIIACEIGIVLMLTGWRPPQILEETITSVSNCNTAMSMLVIGMILADADPKTIIDKDVLFYTFIRLLIIPFCVFIPCWLLHIDSLVMGVSVILAAMPAGATTTILASKYDCEEEFSVKLVVFSTAASLITTPLWNMILLKFWFAAGKGDSPKERRYHISVTLSLWGECSPFPAHIQTRSKNTDIGYLLSWGKSEFIFENFEKGFR